ncbi:MAG: thiamine biosynthesis protein ThiS [Desulfobacter sp.]|nr:thiamine biosynthesis protein ThiS [Desulfobacter sp.]WDP87898.1 MAG: thiamine biosynthesis protein ThiS [Desulfobacter sp.]
MPNITFNAFSFLQKKLKARGLGFSNLKMDVAPGTSARDLIFQMQLKAEDVEVVFINGRVKKLSTQLKDNHRVAFVPHGTPGPYRVLLGFKNN